MSSVVPKQVGLVEAVADLATGGAVTLATAARTEQLRAMTIAQTTAGQSVTLPDPTDTSVIFSLDVINIGSAAFTMYGVTVSANAKARFAWTGTAFVPDVAPTATGSTVETLTPTADNTVPNVATAPKAGTSQTFFVNGALVPAGITMDAAGAVTIVPATVGYNVSVTDTVTVIYYT